MNDEQRRKLVIMCRAYLKTIADRPYLDGVKSRIHGDITRHFEEIFFPNNEIESADFFADFRQNSQEVTDNLDVRIGLPIDRKLLPSEVVFYGDKLADELFNYAISLETSLPIQSKEK